MYSISIDKLQASGRSSIDHCFCRKEKRRINSWTHCELYDSDNIPSSMHTIPTQFSTSVPKSSSSSLIKWLISTKKMFGDTKIGPNQVENNVLWENYVNEMIHRTGSICWLIWLCCIAFLRFDPLDLVAQFNGPLAAILACSVQTHSFGGILFEVKMPLELKSVDFHTGTCWY